jgi:hypothetical protein
LRLAFLPLKFLAAFLAEIALAFPRAESRPYQRIAFVDGRLAAFLVALVLQLQLM